MIQTPLLLPDSTVKQEPSELRTSLTPEADTSFQWEYRGAAPQRRVRIKAHIRKITQGKPAHYEDTDSE